MKVLIVTGEPYGTDYAALSFEQKYRGVAVEEVIDNLQNYQDDSNEEYYLEVKEFGDIDMEFVNFLRTDLIDYDHQKHTAFYLETETIQ